MDWDSLWGQAKDYVQSGLDQFNAVGVPAIQASAEQWALDMLNKQHAATTAQLSAGVKQLSEGESSALGSAVKQVAKDTILTNYGGHIMIGVVVIGVAGYLVLRK